MTNEVARETDKRRANRRRWREYALGNDGSVHRC